MQNPKLFTALSLLGLPFVSAACDSEFNDCSATRSCSTGRGGSSGAGASGAAGSAGASAGSSGKSGGGSSGGSAGRTSGGSSGAAASGGSAGSSGSEADSGAGGDEVDGEAGAAGQTNGSSGSGGHAGTGENAGEGGDAGGSEPSACDVDADCDDKLFCNGVETCEDGECKDAAEPFECENPDSAHCRTHCEEGDGEATCVVEARDDDGDGYRTAQCEEAPGDDCNDQNDEIHPGEAEACDGIDNDCDELVDMGDGLALSGTTKSSVGIKSLDIGFLRGGSGVGAQFRLCFTQTDSKPIFSARLDSSGALDSEVMPLTAPEDPKSDGDCHVAGGNTTFGVTYTSAGYVTTDGNGYSTSVLQTDENGASSLAGSIDGSARRSDIARRASGDWVLSLTEYDQGIQVYRYRETGSVDTKRTLSFGTEPVMDASWVRIAAHGDESAVIWQSEPNLVRWARLSSSLAATDGAALGSNGYHPDIASTQTGYAMSWATGTGIFFMRASANGQTSCSNEFVDLGFDAQGDLHQVALADTDFGTLVLATSEEGKVVLVRFEEDCEVSALVPVASSSSARSPALAVGSDSIALAWVNRNSAIAYTRLVGERLCD